MVNVSEKGTVDMGMILILLACAFVRLRPDFHSFQRPTARHHVNQQEFLIFIPKGAAELTRLFI